MPSKFGFFEVRIGKEGPYRIEFELFSDVVPKTVLNFIEFCRGTKIDGRVYSYKNSVFHRVVKNFMVQGGDMVNGDGTGRLSIYGKTFPDENFKLKHDKPYLLSMANSGTNTNGCQFFVTCVPCPHLDEKHVVFGKVTKGQKIVDRIEYVDTDNKSKPLADIIIINCGEMKSPSEKSSKEKEKPKKKSGKRSSSSSSDSSESSSDSDDGKKRKRKTKKRKDSSSSSGSSSSSESSSSEEEKEEEANQEKENTTAVKISDIPDMPAEKNFLYRHSKTPERKPKDGEEKDEKRKEKKRFGKDIDRRDRGDRRRSRERSRSRDRQGRHERNGGRLSGRMAFRRSRSRSRSPRRDADRGHSSSGKSGDKKIRGRGVSMFYSSVVKNEEPHRWTIATNRTQKYSDFIKKKEEADEEKAE